MVSGDDSVGTAGSPAASALIPAGGSFVVSGTGQTVYRAPVWPTDDVGTPASPTGLDASTAADFDFSVVAVGGEGAVADATVAVHGTGRPTLPALRTEQTCDDRRIVLDCGSSMSKFGWAGFDAPHLAMGALVGGTGVGHGRAGRPWEASPIDWDGVGTWMEDDA